MQQGIPIPKETPQNKAKAKRIVMLVRSTKMEDAEDIMPNTIQIMRKLVLLRIFLSSNAPRIAETPIPP
jgi:hypothetical protein